MRVALVGGGALSKQDYVRIDKAEKICCVNHHFMRQALRPHIVVTNGHAEVNSAIFAWMESTEYYIPRIVSKALLQEDIVSAAIDEAKWPVTFEWWMEEDTDWAAECWNDVNDHGGSPMTGILAVYYLLSRDEFSSIYVCGFDFYTKKTMSRKKAHEHGIIANAMTLYTLALKHSTVRMSHDLSTFLDKVKTSYDEENA